MPALGDVRVSADTCDSCGAMANFITTFISSDDTEHGAVVTVARKSLCPCKNSGDTSGAGEVLARWQKDEERWNTAKCAEYYTWKR